MPFTGYQKQTKKKFKFKTDLNFESLFPNIDDKLDQFMIDQKMMTSSYMRPEPFNTKLPGLKFFKLRSYTRDVLKKSIEISLKGSMRSYDSSMHFMDLSANVSSVATIIPTPIRNREFEDRRIPVELNESDSRLMTARLRKIYLDYS